MSDPVNHPTHYKVNGMEAIDVAEAFGLDKDAYLFNVLTYILRAGRKGAEKQDLEKALNYLHRRVHGRWIHENEGPPLYYLATPYTKYAKGINAAFMDAAELAARLLGAGHKVYSPIAHTHPVAIHGKIDPLDHDIWLPFDGAMMAKCDALLVAHMDGWQQSKGVLHEIQVFAKASKPIFDLDVDTLAMTPFQRFAVAEVA